MNIISTGSISWKILKSFRKRESRFVVGYFISFILDANCHTCPIHTAWVGLSSWRIESDCDRKRKWEQRRLIGGTGSKRLRRARGWRSWQTDSIGSDGESSSRQESVRERQRKYLSAMKRNKRATHEIYVVLKAMTRNKHATHVTFVVLSHESIQARYTWNVRRSLSHEVKQARYNETYVVLKAMRRKTFVFPMSAKGIGLAACHFARDFFCRRFPPLSLLYFTVYFLSLSRTNTRRVRYTLATATRLFRIRWSPAVCQHVFSPSPRLYALLYIY